MIVIILILVVAIFMKDGLKLIKKKQWKEFIIVMLMLVSALLLQVMKDLEIPSPISIIDKLFRPLGKAVLRH